MIAERAQERSQMIAHIRGLEQQRAGIAGFRIFFTLRPGSRTSMLAICQMLFFLVLDSESFSHCDCASRTSMLAICQMLFF